MSGATAPSGNLEAKRRPGRKGNFAGKRLELLESFVPKWEKARSNRTTGDFWATVNAAYWKTFHWRLEPTEEPSSEASVDEDLSEEDLKAKAAKITLVESQIRSYYNNKRNQARMKSNVFIPWLSTLRKPSGGQPKAKSDHQFYMAHPEYKHKVNFEYKNKFSSKSGAGSESIKERNNIAIKLLAQEPQEVRDALKKEAAEELRIARERYEERKTGLPSSLPEDIDEARENLGHVVQPLIDGIRMFTNTSVTILIGSPPEVEGGSYFVKVLNAGKTLDGRDFHDWDTAGFKTNVLQQFVRFLSQTSTDTTRPNDPTTNSGSLDPAAVASTRPAPEFPTSVSCNPRNPSGPLPPPCDRAVGNEDSQGPEHIPGPSEEFYNDDAPDVPLGPSSHTPSTPSRAPTTPSRAPTTPSRAPTTPSHAPTTPSRAPSTPPGSPHTPTRTAHTRVIPTPLRNEIATLPRAAAIKKRNEVMRMTPYEFLRLCNMARNRVVLASLGLSKTGLVGSSTGRAENKENDETQGAATAAKCGDTLRRSGRLGLKPSCPESPFVNRSNWPEWLAEKFDHYASLEFGETWKNAIVTWTELERMMNFRSPATWHCWQSSGLPSSHRPEQIAIWNQNRRPLAPNRQPSIKNLQAFVSAFWKWWDTINPLWRVREDGRLKIGGSGCWTCFYKPGQNGFLSVLQVLKWWRELLDTADVQEWEAALRDVAWVLHEVLSSLSLSRKRPHALTDDAPDDDNTSSTNAALESVTSMPARPSKMQKTTH